MNKRTKKLQKGITLIALIITIIVLLILAGVTIATLTGENSIILKSTMSSEEYQEAKVREELILIAAECKLQKMNNEGIIDFLRAKMTNGNIDNFYDLGNGKYELEKDGFVIKINEKGEVFSEVQETNRKIEISNLKVTLEDGTEVEESSIYEGTPVQITFDIKAITGTIVEINPPTSNVSSVERNLQTRILASDNKVTYMTNGNQKEIEFIIKNENNGKISTETIKISIESKYSKVEESLLKAAEKITESGSSRKIQINGKNSDGEEELKRYTADVICVNGDLILDDAGNAANNIEKISFNNSTYTLGNAENDCATSANDNAKNMVILKVNGNLIIGDAEGSTTVLTACKDANGYGGPKGLFIYCTGTIINNGNISMTARGAKAPGENVYLWKNANGEYEYIPAVGADGGKAQTGWSSKASVVGGLSGGNGVGRQTGGGGGGYACSWTGLTLTSSRGGNGTSYSGGSGAGCYLRHGSGYTQPNLLYLQGSDEGGSGGNSYVYWDTTVDVISGGVGNAGGIASRGNEKQSAVGTGGLLIIYANELQNNNKISANGVTPNPPTSGSNKGYGSASGGGSINIFLNNDSKIGVLETNGGKKIGGGAGGVGSKSVGKIVNGTYISLGNN